MSAFLERLRRHADNRGIMANLRCVLVDSKKHRAWPVLNRIGVNVTNDVDAFVAGIFATHPEATQTGNFGTTCKVIESRRGDKRSDDNKLTPTERRFQHLLAANGWEELKDRVLRMIRLAQSENVPVNYGQLKTDLRYWNDQTKTEWAAAFWTLGAEPTAKEEV